MEPIYQTKTKDGKSSAAKLSDPVEGYHDYKETLKNFKAAQDNEEGLVPICNHMLKIQALLQ